MIDQIRIIRLNQKKININIQYIELLHAYRTVFSIGLVSWWRYSVTKLLLLWNCVSLNLPHWSLLSKFLWTRMSNGPKPPSDSVPSDNVSASTDSSYEIQQRNSITCCILHFIYSCCPSCYFECCKTTNAPIRKKKQTERND